MNSLKPTKRHNYLLKLPLNIWERLLNHLNHEWGKAAKFITEAITEKLDREEQK